MHPIVQGFFDEPTSTVSYLVRAPGSLDALVIDPVLGFDALRSQTDLGPLEGLRAAVQREGLKIRAILETHAHADHMSGAQFLAKEWGSPVFIGAGIVEVQKIFAQVFALEDSALVDGSQFDVLVRHEEMLSLGPFSVRVLATPGHTPACVSYVIGDSVFTGDALFMHDSGTGRADFPGGSAKQLWESVRNTLYSLPDQTRVFVGHDYQPGGREPAFESRISLEKAHNPHVNEHTSIEQFLALRGKRDAQLLPPRLIYPSIQVNVFGGYLPDEDEHGRRYLQIPLNRRHPTDSVGAPRAAR